MPSRIGLRHFEVVKQKAEKTKLLQVFQIQASFEDIPYELDKENLEHIHWETHSISPLRWFLLHIQTLSFVEGPPLLLQSCVGGYLYYRLGNSKSLNEVEE